MRNKKDDINSCDGNNNQAYKVRGQHGRTQNIPHAFNAGMGLVITRFQFIAREEIQYDGRRNRHCHQQRDKF
jgi:hypothetical protein